MNLTANKNAIKPARKSAGMSRHVSVVGFCLAASVLTGCIGSSVENLDTGPDAALPADSLHYATPYDHDLSYSQTASDTSVATGTNGSVEHFYSPDSQQIAQTNSTIPVPGLNPRKAPPSSGSQISTAFTQTGDGAAASRAQMQAHSMLDSGNAQQQMARVETPAAPAAPIGGVPPAPQGAILNPPIQPQNRPAQPEAVQTQAAPRKKSWLENLFSRKAPKQAPSGQMASRTGLKATPPQPATPANTQIASAGAMGRTLFSKHGFELQTSRVEADCLRPRLVKILRKVERHYGKKVVITSGYRSPSANRRAGGAKNSAHIYCRAADIQIEGVSKWNVAKYLRTLPDRGGVGTYCRTNSVHVDTGSKRDWHHPCRRSGSRAKKKKK